MSLSTEGARSIRVFSRDLLAWRPILHRSHSRRFSRTKGHPVFYTPYGYLERNVHISCMNVQIDLNYVTYQTLSPVPRIFVFLGSRCTQPLTPRNAHALRYEFLKWRTFQRGKLNKQSDFAMNSQHKPSLERRIHRRKIQNCMILRSIWY